MRNKYTANKSTNNMGIYREYQYRVDEQGYKLIEVAMYIYVEVR